MLTLRDQIKLQYLPTLLLRQKYSVAVVVTSAFLTLAQTNTE